jgi:HEAT repeat protein
MKFFILIGLGLLPAFLSHANVDPAFRKDFDKALNKNFSEEQLNNIFRLHSALLTPSSQVTQLRQDLLGSPIDTYPLSEFKSDRLYTENIDKLLSSKNDSHRILAYLVIGSSGDKSKEDVLLSKIKTEKKKGNLIWAGMSLMYLNTNHTTEVFDFLVKNEDFGDAHMLPLFINLNKDSLQKTAYLRIKSKNRMARLLAAQILSVTTLNLQTEELLLDAVNSWDIEVKGYAIYSISQLQMGNLLPTLKPLLDVKQTKHIALQALANSPTDADRLYLLDLINQQDTVSADLLDCLSKSKQVDNVKSWLQILHTKNLPKKYVFFVFEQPLIKSDDVLQELQGAIEKCQNPKVIQELLRALHDRTDDRSTNILLKLLTHDDASVRYWAAYSLQGNHSSKLKSAIPTLLADPIKRVTSLTALAIDNNLNSLHPIYENIRQTENNLDWQRSSVEYLASFPLDRHKDLFKAILLTGNEDFAIRQDALMGLARLKDESSVDLIISICESESATSPLNARTCLVALGQIKGDKALAEIKKFQESSEPSIRDLVAEILRDW